METKHISDVPELMKQWNWQKNAEMGIVPENISIASKKKVFWKCHICGGEWETAPQYRKRNGCPYCANFKALPGFNDLQTLFPDIAAEWDMQKNNSLRPQNVTKGSGKKVWWICPKGHSYDMPIIGRVEGQKCPYCNNRRVLFGFNDLETLNPAISQTWHPILNNGLTPKEVTPGSKKQVWWKCEKGHEWSESVVQRCRSKGCPVCQNRRIIKGINDLATLRPELKMEWDNEKNVRSPEEYSCGSRAVVLWKCKKGHRWKAAISDRNRGNSCPKCAEERRVSFPEKAVLYYVEKVFTDVKANYKPEWLGLQELDIYIPEYKIAIEYDGIYGHSKLSGNKRDEKKNIICQENSIILIRVREPGCMQLNTDSINYIHNRELMEQCKILREYAQYVAKVRNYTEKMKLDTAVECAVKECIREGILEEFLRKNRAEVVAVSIFEYNKEEEEKKLREAEYEAGYDSGRQDGLTEGELRKAKETAAELAKLGMASTQIADVLKTEEAVIFQWLEECAK